MSYDIIIKNGLYFDGSGTQARVALVVAGRSTRVSTSNVTVPF